MTVLTNIFVPILVALIGAIAAIFTGLSARKLRISAGEHAEALNSLRTAQSQIEDLQHDVLLLKRAAFALRAKLAGANIRTPDLPPLRSEKW